MVVNVKLIIEKNARACQILFHENSEVAELYDGQFQGGTTAWMKAK
jgi:deoxycytidine triphosphate deaminase